MAPNSASMPFATAMPPPMPPAVAITPDQERLAQHRAPDLPWVGADGAQQGELPGALAEHDAERVVDDEHRHEQGDRAEPEQDVADEVDLVGELGVVSCETVAWSTTSAGGTAGAIAA